MPLQTGPWQIVMNGTQGTLSITSVDTSGLVTGNLNFGPNPAAAGYAILGRWDEAGKRLNFHTVRSVLPPGAGRDLAFTGYLFKDAMRMPGLPGDVAYTLAGHYLDFSDTGSPDQHDFGWYAQLGVA
jgi:hypothetical protein